MDEKCNELDTLICIKKQKLEKLEQYKKSVTCEYVTEKRRFLQVQIELTPYAERLLKEIFDHRSSDGTIDSQYWVNKFENLTFDEDSLCRSCFKELSDAELVKVMWADNCPYHMTITERGRIYFKELNEQGVKNMYSPEALLENAREILKTEYRNPPQGVIGYDYIKGSKYDRWIADLRIMQVDLPDSCPLKEELANEKYYTNNSVKVFQQAIGLLESLVDWKKKHTRRNR